MSQSQLNLTESKPYTEAEIKTWILTHLAKQLNTTPETLDPNLPFDGYGLDSAHLMMLLSEAEQLLGFQVSPILLWHYPTVNQLSQRLAEDLESSDLEIVEI